MTRRLQLLLLFCALMAYAGADGSWMERVPAKDHDRTNPLDGQATAVEAGRNVFVEHCAKCHGENAQGTKKRPALRSERVQQQATPGDLHWLLVNGNMKKGMPSWAKLPDPQLWQLISYLKSIHE